MQRTDHVTGLDLIPQSRKEISGYGLIKRRGRGGGAEVWEATSPGGYRVALKLVHLSTGLRAGELRALHITRSIRHPSLLEVFGTWQVENLLVICMELADLSLWDRFLEVTAQGLRGVPRGELLGYLESVADAIDYLNDYKHSVAGRDGVGIQHRDLKPQNLLLLGGRAKVADFGLVQVMEQAVASHTGHCTLPYAAPEYFFGKMSRQSDQYALAVTYCQLRGGGMPFQGTLAQITFGHLYSEPDLGSLPAPERPIVARALAKKPEDRWPDCRAFVGALQALGSEAACSVPDHLPRDRRDTAAEPSATSGSAAASSLTFDPADSDFFPVDTASFDSAGLHERQAEDGGRLSAGEIGDSDFIPVDSSLFDSAGLHELQAKYGSRLSAGELGESDFIPIDGSSFDAASLHEFRVPDEGSLPTPEPRRDRLSALTRFFRERVTAGRSDRNPLGALTARMADLRPRLARIGTRVATLAVLRTNGLVGWSRTRAARLRAGSARVRADLRPRLARITNEAATRTRMGISTCGRSGRSLAVRLRGEVARLVSALRPKLGAVRAELATHAVSGTNRLVGASRALGNRLRTGSARVRADLGPRLARITGQVVAVTMLGTSTWVRSNRSLAARLRFGPTASDTAAWMAGRLPGSWRLDRAAAFLALGLVGLVGGLWTLSNRSRPAVMPSSALTVSRTAPGAPGIRIESPAAPSAASNADRGTPTEKTVAAVRTGDAALSSTPGPGGPAHEPGRIDHAVSTASVDETTALESADSTGTLPAPAPAPSLLPVPSGPTASEVPALVGPVSTAVASATPIGPGPLAAAVSLPARVFPRSMPTPAPAVRDQHELEDQAEPSGVPAGTDGDPSPAPAGPVEPSAITPVLTLPATVSVMAGKTTNLSVEMKRSDPSKPAHLEFRGLPRGIRVQDPTIPAGSEKVDVVVSASAEASPGTAEVVGVLTSGSQRVETTVELTVLPSPATLALERGRADLERRAFDQAIAGFAEAIRLDPDCFDAHFQRGVAYSHQGRHREALADLDSAIRITPGSADAHRARARVHRELGEYRLALEDFNEAIRLRPDAQVYVARGSVLHELGDYDRALADYESALRLRPDDPAAHYRRGLTRYILGDNSGAIPDFTAVIRRDPQHADAYHYRGDAFARLGEYSRAGADHDVFVRLSQPSGQRLLK